MSTPTVTGTRAQSNTFASNATPTNTPSPTGITTASTISSAKVQQNDTGAIANIKSCVSKIFCWIRECLSSIPGISWFFKKEEGQTSVQAKTSASDFVKEGLVQTTDQKAPVNLTPEQWAAKLAAFNQITNDLERMETFEWLLNTKDLGQETAKNFYNALTPDQKTKLRDEINKVKTGADANREAKGIILADLFCDSVSRGLRNYINELKAGEPVNLERLGNKDKAGYQAFKNAHGAYTSYILGQQVTPQQVWEKFDRLPAEWKKVFYEHPSIAQKGQMAASKAVFDEWKNNLAYQQMKDKANAWFQTLPSNAFANNQAVEVPGYVLAELTMIKDIFDGSVPDLDKVFIDIHAQHSA